MISLHKVQDLNPYRTNWRIVVKVHKKWEESNPGGDDILHFIFVDESGKKIKATTDLESLKRFFSNELHEGQWYIVTDFTVIFDPSPFRVTASYHRIMLVANTYVERVLEPTYSHHMSFADFGRVLDGSFDMSPLIDLIGVIEYMDQLRVVWDPLFVQPSTQKITRIKFTIKDNADIELECVAYGKLAVEINYQRHRYPDDDVICVLSDWRVSTHGGEYHMEDYGGVSRVLIEPDIPEVNAFRDIMIAAAQPSEGESDTEVTNLSP